MPVWTGRLPHFMGSGKMNVFQEVFMSTAKPLGVLRKKSKKCWKEGEQDLFMVDFACMPLPVRIFCFIDALFQRQCRSE